MAPSKSAGAPGCYRFSATQAMRRSSPLAHRPTAQLHQQPPTVNLAAARQQALNSYTQTYNDAGLAQSRLWPKGTLCITIAANIARTGILTFDGCFPDSVVGFVAFDGAIATRWVELVIRSMQDRLEQLAPATAQRNINLRVLRSLEIPFPSQSYQVETLAEYDRRISLISSLALTLTRSAQRADTLRSALLAEAFSGKLVRQDPDDEPASVLLQSIFDQRATLSGNRSRSKGPRRTKVGI